MIKPVYAQEIVNPALGIGVPKEAGAGLAFYIAQLWMTVVIVGGLAALLFMIWGGLQWLMVSWDMAYHKNTNSWLSLVIWLYTFAAIYFMGSHLKIRCLNRVFPVES